MQLESKLLMDKEPHERRLFARHKAEAAALMLFDGAEIPCEVIDVSSGGVQVKSSRLPPAGKAIVLRFGNIGEISAKSVWRHSDRCGLQFVGDSGIIAELLMAIAIYG